MLRAAFVMAALDAGVPSRDVQIAARHADQRNTTVYERRRQNYDRHAAYAAYAVVAIVTSGRSGPPVCPSGAGPRTRHGAASMAQGDSRRGGHGTSWMSRQPSSNVF